ncbi:hypothetical protein [Brachybacterium massiliense]|uniref:hypothetical protein n=1 Tax=Brachybacterium massiliense TaxID=1755098 RepID=UPI000B3BBA6E|nr:hypothetical protein [Brachybacterium massiliense]
MAQIHALTPEGRLPTAAVAHVEEVIDAATPHVGPWRDITARLDSSRVIGGRVYIRRSEGFVEYSIAGLATDSNGVILTWGDLPLEYRPTAGTSFLVYGENGSDADLTPNYGGGMSLARSDQGVPYWGTGRLATDQQWPTEHPGVEAGWGEQPDLALSPADAAQMIGRVSTDVDGLGARLAIVGAGRPDVTGSMIGSVASAVADAPSGTTFVSTDGPQGAWQWQKRGTTWTVTDGTIAPRDVPFIDGTILTTRPGISTTISRTGDRVTLSIVNVLAVSSAPFSQAQQPIPAGFRPAQEFNGLLTKGSAEQHARLLVQTSGNVIVASASGLSGACAATASWVTTDPWPTTLPGDPA